MDVAGVAVQQRGEPRDADAQAARGAHPRRGGVDPGHLAQAGQARVEELDVLGRRALLRAEHCGCTGGAGGRRGDVGKQQPLERAGGDIDFGGVQVGELCEGATARFELVAGLVDGVRAERDEDAGAAVDRGGAAEAQDDTLRAARFRIRDEHAGAIGVAGERYRVVSDGGEAGGCGDVDVGGLGGRVVGVGRLGETPGGVRGGESDALTSKKGGGALAAIGHGCEGDVGVADDAADALAEPLCGLFRSGGALERVWCNNDARGGRFNTVDVICDQAHNFPFFRACWDVEGIVAGCQE